MYWLTEIKAIDPKTGKLLTWGGPKVWAVTMGEAQSFCNVKGFGYCKVIGKFCMELPYEDMIVWQN